MYVHRHLHSALEAEDLEDWAGADEAARNMGEEALRLVALIVASRGLLSDEELTLAIDAVVAVR